MQDSPDLYSLGHSSYFSARYTDEGNQVRRNVELGAHKRKKQNKTIARISIYLRKEAKESGGGKSF